ncbi:MAG: DUF1501 domain-containing protein [Planctomycetales bacterium]
MTQSIATEPRHPASRRELLQAGTIGLLGLSTAQVAAWRQTAQAAGTAKPRPRAVIFLFLTGGPSQHDTFDMKPLAPDVIRGEFRPIATSTPGVEICEHLPQLAQRGHLWSLCRSLAHKDNGHDTGTYLMLTGRSTVPSTFRSSRPQSTDQPSIAAIAGYSTQSRHGMPKSAMLPEKIYHSNTGVYPGQFAGLLGTQHEPWLIEATDKPHAYHSYSGAFPQYLFNLHKGEPSDKQDWRFEVPNISLPEGVFEPRFRQRMELLEVVENQRRAFQARAASGSYDAMRTSALSLMADPQVRQAIDVRRADPKTLERYGDNSFGWSLLMARRLVEVGVNMVQVNMGNFGSWDLHGNNFPCLKDYLFPPTDRAVAALLDDLSDSGLLDETLVVMAGEFGRTPRITHIATDIYKYPGRDHWGPLQSVWFAGGGVAGGRVIGSSDAIGAYPASGMQTPENFAATIYHALGIPREALWYDVTGRPNPVYMADPIEGLWG